ncbi:MAG: PfkB family carbohydrate kinase [Treponema sp.]|jgi:sugar/nucleoside kinase (ribokinase family)|nr:PfkB family carbohydrate kinase [Treponema sp.]
MNQTLIIGSTVIDVLLAVPRLPRRGEDVNITASVCRLGGCAYNVYKSLRRFGSGALLCSPVGGGVYGRMVREGLAAEGLRPFVELEEENGCCYCLVEEDGERSFLSLHGAEYLFSRSWMDGVDYGRTGSVFICGLEVEDSGGDEIVDFVCARSSLDLFFAPGPRIAHIGEDRMARLLARRGPSGRGPFLHLNEAEAVSFSGKDTVEKAADFLFRQTGNSLVITLGARGCYYREQEGGAFAPGLPVRALNLVGVGDAHCGAVIACLKKGMTLAAACEKANAAGAAAAGRTWRT